MNSFWTYKYDISNNAELVEVLAEDRNITFGSPLEFHSPEDLPDFQKAKAVITNAIANCSRILIYGDYDADGITAVTILYKFLSYLTPYVEYFIPDRFTDGYGMNMRKIQEIIDSGSIDLVITVDNGITAIEQVKALKDNGIKVIITDHHTCLDILPEADAVINCHRSDSSYPFNDLCGAGVAFKLVQGINNTLEYKYTEMAELLDLAALGTVADIVSLLDENRTIVANSLQSIKDSPNIGIRAIITSSETLRTKATISAKDIAFSIAPMINAASRMGRIDIVLELLNSESFEQAMELASQLNDINNDRKFEESFVTSEALKLIAKEGYDELAPIVIAGENWHKGVIGITAAKIAERFQCPVFIGTIKDGTITGSARSYGDYNIIEALSAVSESLITYGGHVGAGGFSLKLDDFAKFKTDITTYSYDHPWSCSEHKQADACIPIAGISLNLLSDLNKLAPFGESNAEPVFISKDVKIESICSIGKDHNTLKMTVKNTNGDRLNCIGFSMGAYADGFSAGEIVSIVYNLSLNSYVGRNSVQAMLIDIESPNILSKAEETAQNWDDTYMSHRCIFNHEYDDAEVPTGEIPSNNEYKLCFPAITAVADKLAPKSNVISLPLLAAVISNMTHLNISPAKMLRLLEVTNETNFVKVIISYNMNIIFASSDEDIGKVRISLTPMYKYLSNIK